MPSTDREFNDWAVVKKMTEELDGVTPAADLTELEKDIRHQLNKAFAENVTERLDAERIEDFRPTGLQNLPDVEVTLPAEQVPAVLLVDLVHPTDQPRTLRQILFSHRALAGADALEITELMAELQPLIRRGWPDH